MPEADTGSQARRTLNTVTARGAAACWLVAGSVYLSLEAVAARAVADYSYAHNFISDLGRPDSPQSHLMNAAFVGQGTLFFAGAALLVRAARPRKPLLLLSFGAANMVGNILVAAVPSGPTGIGWLHVTGAALAIVGGNAAIVAGSTVIEDAGAPRWYRAASIGLGGLGLLSVGFVAVGADASWERISVYTIIGWQILSAVFLLRAAGSARR